MTRRGAALVLALAATVVLALGAVTTHRLALHALSSGRSALASARAREAAASGIAVAVGGGPAAGFLPGGAGWVVYQDTTLTGWLILTSHGSTTLPGPASLEVLATATLGDSITSPRLLRRWVVMRR